MLWILAFVVLSLDDAGPMFLVFAPGAKAVSMGSAFTAICDDATACYYNPGSLAFHEKSSISSMNLSPPLGIARVLNDAWREHGGKALLGGSVPDEPSWLPGFCSGMKQMYWAAVLPFKRNQALGVSYNYFSSGETIGTDHEGNEIGPWNSYDYSVGLSYARQINRFIGLGAKIKYIYSLFAPSEIVWIVLREEGAIDGRALALDLGLFARAPVPGVTIGSSVQNIGTRIRYTKIDEGDPLPGLIRTGMAVSPIEVLEFALNEHGFPVALSSLFNCTYTGEVVMDLVGNPHETYKSAGVEVTLLSFLSYRRGYFEGVLGTGSGDTRGYGVKIGALRLDIATDGDVYDWPDENWRAQVNLMESTKPEIAVRHKWIDNSLRFLSCFLLPGGGQFYNNEPMKGLPILAVGSWLGHEYFRTKTAPFAIATGALYVGAALEAFRITAPSTNEAEPKK